MATGFARPSPSAPAPRALRASTFREQSPGVGKVAATTRPSTFDLAPAGIGALGLTDADIARIPDAVPRYLPPPVHASEPLLVAPDSSVIQIWEGRVLSVDVENDVMHALLEPKPGAAEPHAGDIELQWVTDQDKDLVTPGAVFYLTLYKRVDPGGTIENAEEIRFRRLPAWSKQQIAKIEEDTQRMLTKLRPRPLAE